MEQTARSRVACLIGTALVFLGGATGGSAETVDLRHLQGLGEVRYLRLDSEILERGFHLFVRLPETYAERGADRFATVYLLDGGITFPLLGAYYRYLSLEGAVPDLILVGISYGSDDWGRGNYRGTDFTAPAADREHYGGAARFQEVLRTELLPLVEDRYRSDPSRRLVFGQSLGGQFVLFTAFTNPGLFWGHIASNPALHRNLELFLRDPFVRTSGESGGGEQPAPDARPRLFVSRAGLDARFGGKADRWIEHWTGRQDRPWDLRAVTLEGYGHFSAAPEAFRQGLAWILESPPATGE